MARKRAPEDETLAGVYCIGEADTSRGPNRGSELNLIFGASIADPVMREIAFAAPGPLQIGMEGGPRGLTVRTGPEFELDLRECYDPMVSRLAEPSRRAWRREFAERERQAVADDLAQFDETGEVGEAHDELVADLAPPDRLRAALAAELADWLARVHAAHPLLLVVRYDNRPSKSHGPHPYEVLPATRFIAAHRRAMAASKTVWERLTAAMADDVTGAVARAVAIVARHALRNQRGPLDNARRREVFAALQRLVGADTEVDHVVGFVLTTQLAAMTPADRTREFHALTSAAQLRCMAFDKVVCRSVLRGQQVECLPWIARGGRYAMEIPDHRIWEGGGYGSLDAPSSDAAEAVLANIAAGVGSRDDLLAIAKHVLGLVYIQGKVDRPAPCVDVVLRLLFARLTDASVSATMVGYFVDLCVATGNLGPPFQQAITIGLQRWPEAFRRYAAEPAPTDDRQLGLFGKRD
jgi:hypothetical protein